MDTTTAVNSLMDSDKEKVLKEATGIDKLEASTEAIEQYLKQELSSNETDELVRFYANKDRVFKTAFNQDWERGRHANVVRQLLKLLVPLDTLERKSYLEDIKAEFDTYNLGELRDTLNDLNIPENAYHLEQQGNDQGEFSKDFTEEYEIDTVRSVLNNTFPELWHSTKTALAVVNSLLLKDSNNPVGVNFVGDPSGGKTTVLSFFYGIDQVTYKTDDFTPASFVSHSANTPKGELEEIDLLPKIKHKTMIVPELAPIFGKRKEDLVENLSILTRVFDGEGLQRDSGTVGRRGYEGDYLFSWLGATTPLKHSVWKTMGKLGSRLFFYWLDNSDTSDQELKEDVHESVYKDKVEACRDAVHDFVQSVWKHHGGPRSVTWKRDQDSTEAQDVLAACSQLISRLRATVQAWQHKGENGENYEHKTPQTERPHRIMQVLYNLCRGNALAHGRRYLKVEDCDIAVNLMVSSMSQDRRLIFKALCKHDGFVDKYDLAGEMGCSQRHARRIMNIMQILDVGEIVAGEQQTKLLQFKSNVKRWVARCSSCAHGVEFMSTSMFEGYIHENSGTNKGGHENDAVSHQETGGGHDSDTVRGEDTEGGGHENDTAREHYTELPSWSDYPFRENGHKFVLNYIEKYDGVDIEALVTRVYKVTNAEDEGAEKDQVRKAVDKVLQDLKNDEKILENPAGHVRPLK